MVGASREYYGRCVCPDGYYKAGFSTTTCTKTEYLQETWDAFKGDMETITELTDEFADQAFTVKALNSDDAYTDYLNKLLSFTIQFVDEA